MIELNKIYEGKMEIVLPGFPANYCDSIVTDPPYGLKFMGKKWDYDVPTVAQWKEAFRVLKPGGYMLAACGTRTQHRMVVNIEDAGFEIRDVITWHYGSGFPKSLDISKAIDKASGAEREVIGERNDGMRPKANGTMNFNGRDVENGVSMSQIIEITEPSTDEAKQWEGWGTALKPATEFWTLCRKPLSENTVAENVLKHGTGGINIDACRIEGSEGDDPRLGGNGSWKTDKAAKNIYEGGYAGEEIKSSARGRFPANLILDDFMAVELDKQSGNVLGGRNTTQATSIFGSEVKDRIQEKRECDSGGASRFFYVAKPSKRERNKGCEKMFWRKLNGGSHELITKEEYDSLPKEETAVGNIHPTVKPVQLMQYLVRMITPKGGICFDPYAGSGSTAIAAELEDVFFIAVESIPNHVKIAENRLAANCPAYDLI